MAQMQDRCHIFCNVTFCGDAKVEDPNVVYWGNPES